jgi:hypothetical protein
VSSRLLSVRDIPTFASREDERFERISDSRYVLNLPDVSTDLEVDHVRRDRSEQLVGEVTVHCGLSGVRTVNGVLLTASINLSNLRDRYALGRAIGDRTSTQKIAGSVWAAHIDELATRVHQAERTGAGVVNLREVARPSAELLLPKHHPAIFFGDGDALKTYIGLHVLSQLRKAGVRTGIADWELQAPDHRERGERLDGEAPDVIYIPCTRPLVYEADRIARAIHEHALDYLLIDSAAPACQGGPENSEAAQGFFQVLRVFNIGTLTIAHTNRSEQSDQKPFGSVFWFNLARAIWYVKRADVSAHGSIEIGLYPRKFNLGAPQRPAAFRFTFTDTATVVTAANIADVESLASKLPLKDRIVNTLKNGARSIAEIASAIPDTDPDSISRTIRRYSGDTARVCLFTRLADDRIGVAQRKAS